MPEAGGDTFARLLTALINSGTLGVDDSILVQFGGSYDEKICHSLGLRNCHFTNIAPGSKSTGVTKAEAVDAHKMPGPDRSFDHVIAHAGLHHCSRPHEALHEMYRLARKVVLFVENQDSTAMRIASHVGVVGAYENAAVINADYRSGGVDGTPIPNHVYRWTRREVLKTVASFDPGFDIPIEFHAEWNFGLNRVASAMLRSKLHLSSEQRAATTLDRMQRVANRVLPGQGNIFAATIRKDQARLKPWMASPYSMKGASADL